MSDLSAATPLFVINDLLVRRPQSDGSTFELSIDALTLPRGEIVAIIGVSGTGKSTLLNVLGGLEQPSAGVIDLALVPGGPRVRVGADAFPNVKVGRVFQQGHLIQDAAVSVNLELAFRARGRVPTRADMLAVLSKCGLGPEHLDTRTRRLSGGQQQRLAFARAIAGDPDLIIADEPTSSLDPDLAKSILGYLKAWITEGGGQRSAIWVTHSYQQVEEFADSVLVLKRQGTADAPSTNVIEHETAPRAAPDVPPVERNTRILQDWVGTVGFEHRAEGTPAPATAKDPGRVAGSERMISKSLIFSRDGKEANDVDHYLSTTFRKTPSLVGFISSFREWGLLTGLLAAILLMGGLFLGWMVQQDQVRNVLEDPAVCSVVVAGAAHRDKLITPDRIGLLGGAPWRDDAAAAPFEFANRFDMHAHLDAQPLGAGCNPEFPVWPRFSRHMTVWLANPGETCAAADAREAPLFRDTLLLGLHHKEPLLTTMQVTGAAPEATAGAVLTDLQQTGPRMGAVLSSSFVDTQMGGPEALGTADRICLEIRGGDPVPVAILGLSDGLPSDRFYEYDVLVPLDAYERAMERDQSPNYDAAAIYFSADDISAIDAYLRPRDPETGTWMPSEFVFDADALSRLGSSFQAASLMKAIFIAVGTLALIVTFFSSAASATALLNKTERPLAMLITLGFKSEFGKKILYYHARFVWLIAALLAFVVMVALWLANLIGFVSLSNSGVTVTLLLLAWVTGAASVFAISRLSVFFSHWIWSGRAKTRLASILQGS